MRFAALGIAGWAALVLSVLPSCNGNSVAHWDCSNGECTCLENHDCAFSCNSPPCKITCASGATCDGACADSNCECEEGATCSFVCNSPPCHVLCDGNNASCDGTCADGSCTCGVNSSCAFQCQSPPCHATCAAGSRCTLRCPTGLANDAGGNCQFDSCAAGSSKVCPDGVTIACNASCPGT